jgi:DHA2 family multidrug resistance protein
MSTPAQPAAATTPTPWIGLLAVLIGAFISALTGRLSTFGLADIRGAVHAGFDEGAWITTAQTVGQMLIAPIAVWAGNMFGARRVLLDACLAFAVISFAIPFSPNLDVLLLLQFAGGLATGCFLPLTLGFIARNLPPKLWAYGIAVYALNLEFSLNISASLEGWYVEHASWHWIFWQNVPLALTMAAAVAVGIAREPVNPAARRADVFGIACAGLGLALLYAALDQGNRLDWLTSGTVAGLLVGGGLLVVLFVIHELRTPEPWINLSIVVRGNLPVQLLLIVMLRFVVLSTGYLIPQFLTTVRGFRALEVGQAMLWIALPQLLICPITAFMLRRSDPRIGAGLGFALMAGACWSVAVTLTPAWGPDQFLVSQLVQAIGQSLAISGAIFIGLLNINPAQAMTFGAMIQIARLFGGEAGLAFIATSVRHSAQHASNIIGQHVVAGAGDVASRLQGYAAAVGADSDATTGAARASSLLAQAVRTAANTQAIIDGFAVMALGCVAGLFVLLFLRSWARTPASHVPFWRSRKAVST